MISIALRSALILAAMALTVIFAVRLVSPQDLRSLSKAEWDSARAKWRSQSVTEYEIVIHYGAVVPYAGTLTLHVRDAHIELITPTIEMLSDFYANPPSSEDFRFLTVEGMFDDIERKRNTLQSGNASDIDKNLDYYVRFHQDLGYPTRFESFPKPDRTTNDSTMSIEVLDLKILQRK
jgi:hypothetical protein